MTIQTPGTPGAPAPRDGDTDAAASTETSRNATDDAARDGRSDSEDDLDSEEDPSKLRQMLRDLRKSERKRNEGYNSLQQQVRDLQGAASTRQQEALANAPLEERVKAMEKELADERAKNTRLEQERKDERTDGAIREAARRLNAADPDDVVRLLDRDDLTIEEDGNPTNAEAIVRAMLRKKPHLTRAGGGGGADGGNRGTPGKGSSEDMNDLLRSARGRGR